MDLTPDISIVLLNTSAEFDPYQMNSSVYPNDNVSFLAGGGDLEQVTNRDIPSPEGQFNYHWLLTLLNGFIIPGIAAFGFIGNLLNLVILSVRCSKREVDVLERGALTVLIALALSDMLFCIMTLPYFVFQEPNKAMFRYRGFEYYFKIYGFYFRNVFIKISTALTCVVGLARYIGICHPIRARIFIGIWGIRIAIISCYGVWLIFMAPLLWNYTVIEHSLTNTSSLYIFDIGPLQAEPAFRSTFYYLWSILGYFIPITVLAFCNTCLIRALRQSVRLRNRTVQGQGVSQRQRDANSRITLTLVALIVMYMVLVSPSEVLAFYSELVESHTYKNFALAMTFANVLQAINVAFHFVLYCCVNATFRRTMYAIMYKFHCKKRVVCKMNEPGTSQSVVSMATTRNGTSPCSHSVHVKLRLITNHDTNGTML